MKGVTARTKPELYSVPCSFIVVKILSAVDFLHIVRIETAEVDEFASRVYLSLVAGLALVEHRSRVHFVAVSLRNELARLHENGSSLVPVHVLPLSFCFKSAFDSLLDFFFAAKMAYAENVFVIVRSNDFHRFARSDLFAADDKRDLDFLFELCSKFVFQKFLFSRTRSISVNRFILRTRNRIDSVCHFLLL